MKKIIVILFLVTLKQIVFAQKKEACYAGVYLTKGDFVHNHLSYKIYTDSPGNKFSFTVPADWALTIKIVTPNNVYTFKQGTIFGYYECGKMYRYSSGEELYASEDYFRVEEDRNMVIYTSVYNGGNEYYYSVNLTSPIRRLNMKNLEEDYAAFPAFIDAVRKLKKEGLEGDFSKHDNNGRFLINDVYDQTVKK